MEIAFLREGRPIIGLEEFFLQLDTSPTFSIVPITTDIALEAAALAGALRDPADCVIVASARLFGIPLLTSDQRIIDSDLVDIID